MAQGFIQKEVRLQPRADTAGSFQIEKRNLQLLHCLKHDNIVELLCSYSTRKNGCERHFFIFREEPMDLQAFFALSEVPGGFSDPYTYYAALQGLASALHSIHNFKLDSATRTPGYTRTGSHRDLRPHNILVRADTMLIADFGLADFKDPDRSRGSQTLWKAGRGDYIAPECYGNSFERRVVGRSLDTWAFGCMIIDIATYMTGGHTALERFRASRISLWLEPVENGFFFHNEALKSSVANQIASLERGQADPACVALMRAARKMLVMLPENRMPSLEIWTSMQHACLVKICDQATLELAAYDHALKARGDSAPSQTTLWFERARLRSWADIVGVAGSSTWHLFDSVQAYINIDGAQSLFCAARNLTTAQHKRMITAMDLEDEGAQAASLHLIFQERLTDYVQKLFDLLSVRLQRRADNWWTQQLLDTAAKDDLTTLATESCDTRNTPLRELGRRAHVKKSLVAVSECSTSEVVDESQLFLQHDRLSGLHEHGIRLYAFYEDGLRSEPVLVEEGLVQSSEYEQLTSEEATIRKVTLARLLATPAKPSSFHVLDCIGFIDGLPQGSAASSPKIDRPTKFLYKLPDGYSFPDRNHSEDQMPQDLLWVLENKQLDVPALERRISLAQVLVTSLHSLHLNGWLHKALSSNSILLFPHAPGIFDLSAPRIVGFTYSRPDGGIWYSAGYTASSGSTRAPDCVHPDYIDHKPWEPKPRFRRVYDYYSLGIILLEIGLWKSHRLMFQKYSKPDNITADVRYMEFVPKLYALMGSTYTNAVKKCLQNAFTKDEPGAGAENQLSEFYKDVVEPIVEMGV